MLDLIKLNEYHLRKRIEIHENGCHIWTGGKTGLGYGIFFFPHDGKRMRVQAHRANYQLAHDKVLPSSIVLRHTCDTPECVNPEHLIEGTHQDNVRDRVARGRSATGVNNGRAKLDEEKVLRVRRELGVLVRRFAQEYDVDPKSIRHIVSGQTWKNVRVH